MTDLRESWALTTAHLKRAAALVTDQGLAPFREYLEHNELELAADVLAELGDEHGARPRAYWEALAYAYESMGLPKRAVLCRYRIYEAEHGYVEARLTLVPTAEGGRLNPISTDYRPDWSIGNRTEAGEAEINGAPVTLEDCQSLAPGDTGNGSTSPDLARRLASSSRRSAHRHARGLTCRRQGHGAPRDASRRADGALSPVDGRHLALPSTRVTHARDTPSCRASPARVKAGSAAIAAAYSASRSLFRGRRAPLGRPRLRRFSADSAKILDTDHVRETDGSGSQNSMTSNHVCGSRFFDFWGCESSPAGRAGVGGARPTVGSDRVVDP